MELALGDFVEHALRKLDPQARHREKNRRPRTLQISQESVQVFGEKDVAAKAQRHLFDQHALGHMGQRQVGDVTVARRHGNAKCGTLDAPGHGAKGLHHAFGAPGGARGVNDGANRIGVGLSDKLQRCIAAQQVAPKQTF